MRARDKEEMADMDVCIYNEIEEDDCVGKQNVGQEEDE